MKPSFDHLDARLKGAERDLNKLNADMQAFFKGYGEPVRLRFQSDPKDADAFIVAVHEIAPTQHRWSAEIAHFLYDCRSVLDQTVWQLYVAANGKEPSARVARKLAFPICTSKRAWTDEINRGRLTGIGPAHVAEIERIQPYRLRRRSTHALVRLARMNDMDKHREPTVMLLSGRSFRIGADPHHCRIIAIDQLPGFSRPMKVNAQLGRVRFQPTGTGQPSVDVYCTGTTLPVFENNVPVEESLRTIYRQVRYVIDYFTPRLGMAQLSRRRKTGEYYRRIRFRVRKAVIPTVTITGGCGHWGVERLTRDGCHLVHRGDPEHNGYQEPGAEFEANP